MGPAARGCWQQVVKRATGPLEEKLRSKKVAEMHQNLTLAIMAGVGRQLMIVHQVQMTDPPTQAGSEVSLFS